MPINPNDYQKLLDYFKSNNINPNNLMNSTGDRASTIGMGLNNDFGQNIQNINIDTNNLGQNLDSGLGYPEFARGNGITLDEDGSGNGWRGRRNNVDINRTYEINTPSGEQTAASIEDLMKQGYSKEEAQQMQDSENFVQSTEGTTMPSGMEQGSKSGSFADLLRAGLPYGSAVGTDLDTGAYDIGRYIGMEKGTQGKGLAIAASVGDFLLGSARGITSGIGFEKRNQYVEDWYNQQQNRRNYTRASLTGNTNKSGGKSYGAYGGYAEELPNTYENEGGPIFGRYGNIDWEEYWRQNGEAPSETDVFNRDRREARELARTINGRIRDGEIIDGVDYSQFEKVRPKYFRAEAQKLAPFANGGLFQTQDPNEGEMISFMYGGKKYQGIVTNKEKNMFK